MHKAHIFFLSEKPFKASLGGVCLLSVLNSPLVIVQAETLRDILDLPFFQNVFTFYNQVFSILFLNDVRGRKKVQTTFVFYSDY